MVIQNDIFSQNQFNKNNPTKEIFPSSGIYDQKPYAPQAYAPDRPNTIIPNTGIQVTTTSTTRPPDANQYNPQTDHAFRVAATGRVPPLNRALLTDSNYFVDDMLVFNDYIHYNRSIRFNPQSFLEQAIVSFNRYSLENR